jgi:predicted acylesterase/phospholipase RssA
MTNRRVGLALSGGGARGFAHVGVLRALVDNNIPIDLIAGCSAGSFVGGAFAAGMTIDEIVEVGKKIGWFTISGFSYSPRGMLTNAPLTKLISESFPVTRFEDLKIPFAAVACELETGQEIVLRDTGDIVDAIRASCAIPGVFVPVIDADGRSLVDGGVVSPMPTKTVREMGADVVIAVDLLTSGSTNWGTAEHVGRHVLSVGDDDASDRVTQSALPGRHRDRTADLTYPSRRDRQARRVDRARRTGSVGKDRGDQVSSSTSANGDIAGVLIGCPSVPNRDP